MKEVELYNINGHKYLARMGQLVILLKVKGLKKKGRR
jgi:hypothetical protein